MSEKKYRRWDKLFQKKACIFRKYLANFRRHVYSLNNSQATKTLGHEDKKPLFWN